MIKKSAKNNIYRERESSYATVQSHFVRVCVCLHINPELNRKEVSNKQYISAAFDL